MNIYKKKKIILNNILTEKNVQRLVERRRALVSSKRGTSFNKSDDIVSSAW